MTCRFFDPNEDNNTMRDREFDESIEDLSNFEYDRTNQAEIEKNIDLLENNRKDIQIVNDSMLHISGLLLTVSLEDS